jgi:hypothetical protein
MKQTREIIVDILDNGEIKIETVGFKGKACIEETQLLKELLGAEVAQELKATYYERNGVKSKRHLPLCG